jgi:hypothetical protein
MIWHRSWVVSSQAVPVPPPHAPFARLGPHPEHALLVVRRFDPQVSAQVPGAVPQPDPPEHVTVQHSLPPPTAQVSAAEEHEQVLHTSPVPLQVRVQLPG